MAMISGGKKLEKALARMATQVSRPSSLRVGFLENATYVDGKPVAMIAAIHNWGAPGAGIPPRPFFSNMVAAKKAGWPEAVRINLVANGYDAQRTMIHVGEGIAGQLRQSIIDTNAPPLKPSTIVRKGGTAGMVYDPKDASTFPAKPLVHTGHMLGSVDFDVK